MSDAPPLIRSSPAGTVFLVIGGVLFMALWIAVHLGWASMSLMGSLMANDSGTASTDRHMTLILGLLAGQILAGSAGIPAGLAFFWRGKRKVLLWLFAGLLIGGALIQVAVFKFFFSSMP